ncbi:beta-N-acetylhexosaminidase [Pantoea dispersa]|uniref:beta-N-acetylhexosaminidase n=1 Tax=Pantoea dispersa TaxID=59814 RepID=UPI0007366069|nr:family 20 glycosylhydrolase [Pantoea dispersa]KTS16277.1 beta-N-acetylhexosaminidase [Pantoea dispersa]KTS87997.1 beta-N-acetylhexosaminidase [Pantoea dispersa]
MLLPRTLLAVLCSLTFSTQAAPAGDLPLMPWPQQVTQPTGGGAFTLTPQFSLHITGDHLEGAEARWRARIARQTGWALLPASPASDRPAIQVRIADAVAPLPQPDSDESYHLEVSSSGVLLQAPTRFGAMRGMETLLQLIANTASGTQIPFVTIDDRPRFPWRGVLIDSVRHFLPLETLKRQIDGIAAARMNVFHWHLTDDQGWRFASSHYPQLQQQASDGLFYSQQQMRELVHYATQRGVRVVPEIDLPGHASALAVAMPELMSAPGPYAMERGWGVFKPLLDPSNEAVFRFIDTLIGEVAAIFPDPYIHIGGDEVDPSQWNASPKIQQFMRDHGLQDAHALQAWFNQRVEKILAAHQRRMLGWDEVYHPDLPKSIVIQSWQGQDALSEVVKQGYRGILSTGFYLDQPQSAAYHYRNELWPQGLNGVDQLRADDQAQSWQFTMPRLKGSAVQGSFTLIESKNGWRGFIDFSGKARRQVSDIRWLSPTQLTFSVDSWMGPFQPVVTLTRDSLTGYVLVGNVRYPTTGSRLAQIPAGIAPVLPTPAQLQHDLLGGEAALWAENVNSRVIDTRLWPRAFVVAERLWSAQDVTDSENMYQRLSAIDRWGTVSVGLQQHQQAEVQMMRLANSSDITPLRVLAEVLEPAQYYTRQHLKFQAGHYDSFEPLNRLADVLPAESEPVRLLDKQVDALIANRGDHAAASALRHQLQRWQRNSDAVMPLVLGNYQLKALQPQVRQVAELSRMGLDLVNALERNQAYGAGEVAQMHAQLDAAAQVQDETVLALVRPLEKLLRSSR